MCAVLGLYLSACATTKPVEPAPTDAGTTPIVDTPDIETAPVADPEPIPVPPPPIEPSPPVVTPTPTPAPPLPDTGTDRSGFEELSFWQTNDPTPALKSFKQSCRIWDRRADSEWLNTNLPAYGRIGDWGSACNAAAYVSTDRFSALRFFETHFTPALLTSGLTGAGQLTGYYAPQIDVRRRADTVFSEPILARPSSTSLQNQPRKDINATTSKVLAYGHPMEVFFLQIQGSGQIKFADGTIYRAAFDGHNSHTYVSIGKLLVARGEMTLEQASKQAIEDWMVRAGPVKARALMNENPRYIYFKTERLNGDLGPKGSMGAPLTAMGSIAVDPRYHPYGALVWMRAKLPEYSGDYSGAETGILVSVQDSGGAIKGKMRGDLFFGAGDEAGGRAGVMKHQAVWTVLLPRALAEQSFPSS